MPLNRRPSWWAVLLLLLPALGLHAVEPMVATGYRHNLYLADDGTVWAWGWNGYGQLGDDSTTDRSTPVRVKELTDCVAVAAGYWHSAALKADGTVWVWGSNTYKQLATASAGSYEKVPVMVPSGDLSGVKALATAGFNLIALRSNGDAYCWGYNTNGECGTGTAGGNVATPTIVAGAHSFRAIAGGGQHSLAIADDGTVWAWGWDNNGQLGNDVTLASQSTPVQVSGLSNVMAISAGYYHSLAVTAASAAYAWGDNQFGQIGDGTTTDRPTPVSTGGSFASGFTAGYYHTVMFRSNGFISMWGRNDQGQIRQDPGSVPTQLSSYSPGLPFRSRTVGGTGDTVVLIQDDGSLVSWGANGNGALGIGSTTPTSSFSSNTVLESWPLSAAVGIANGQNHAVALRADGALWSWGYGGLGQIGDGAWTTRATAVRSGSQTGFVQVSAGADFGDHTLARQYDGDLYAFGSNFYGQSGTASSQIYSLSLTAGGSGYTSAPTVTFSGGGGSGAAATASFSAGAVTGLTLTNRGSGYTSVPTVTISGGGGSGATATVTMATPAPAVTSAGGSGGSRHCVAGDYHSLSVSGQGRVYAWGRNNQGQLGNGTSTNSIAPVQSGSFTNAVAVAAGNSFSLALCADGTVWAWGDNYYGQLGLGDNTDRLSPTQITSISGIVAIAAGSYHALALTSTGTVYAWGLNGSGQLGRDTTTDSNVPVLVRASKFYNITFGWLYTSLSGVVAIGAGDHHSLAVTANGIPRSWGRNSSGQLGVGDTTDRLMATAIAGSGAIAVDGGYGFSHGLGADGFVAAMGSNGSGKLGDGSGSTQQSPVEVVRTWLPEVSIVATDSSAAENPSGTATFTVSRRASDCLVASLPVNYAISGTASNGVDYATLSGQVVIPPGATSATITVTPIDDALFESTETIQLDIATTSQDYTISTTFNSASASLVSDEVPQVTAVSSSSANTTYGPGQIVYVTVSFNRSVNVSGGPRLLLETGTTDRYATYSSGSGTSTLTFAYTVQSGDSSADLECASTAALELNGGSISDSTTTYAAVLTLPALGSGGSLSGSKAIVIDGIAPTVTGVSSSSSDGTYFKGQTVSIQVTFNEPVTVGGTPTLTLETGSADAVVSFTSVSTNVLTFTYTVGDGHVSADLAYVSTAALSLAGGSIRDAGNNNATLTLPAIGAAGSLNANKALVIDGKLPVVSSVTASAANGTYGEGAVINVQVVFDEVVYTTGTPRLTLETGSADAVVNYSSGSGTTTLVFAYTVAQNHVSGDLDCLSAAALSLNGGTITDRASGTGNAATLTLPTPGAAGSLGANKALVIEAVRPTVSSVSSANADGSYGAGAAINVTVTFSEAVAVTGTPQITLETGSSDLVAAYASGSGTATLTFTGTVASGQVSADLDAANVTALALNGGTIKDLVANSPNAATLTVAIGGAAGSLSANKAIVIDGVAPTVTQVSSATADGHYNAGDLVYLTLKFSEKVAVTGIPTLTLETGASDAVVAYADGTGSDTLVFTYTVQAGHTSSDLDCVGTSALALSGGTINDLTTNNANAAGLSVPVGGTAGSLALARNLVIDTSAPTGVSSSVSTDNQYFTVNFSEPLYTNADGSGALTVSDFTLTFAQNGGTATGATISAITATDGSALVGGESSVRLTLSISGTPKGVETVACAPASGTAIYDRAGNAMAGAATTGPKTLYDKRGPQVASVSASTANGWYNLGDGIAVTVTFDEAVTVSGTPQLTLETGTTDAVAGYASGSGGTTLTFTFTVAAGHTTADLDYVGTSALALNGGTLTDAVGNAATLVLPAPGAAGSLGASKAIGIDTTVATITGGGVGPLNAYIDVAFSEGVFTNAAGTGGLVAGDFQVAFTAGSGGSGVTGVSVTSVTTTGGGAPAGGESVLRLVLSISGSPVNGTESIAITPATGASIYDRAGNGVDVAQTTGTRSLIDTTAPYVTAVSAASDAFLKQGDSLAVTVSFDQSVTVTGTPTLTLETGAADAVATYTSGSPGSTLTFTYTVGAGEGSADLDTASSDALALNGGSITKTSGVTAAVLTLPTPGQPGSLGANRDIVVDVVAPAFEGAAIASDNSYIQIAMSEGLYTSVKAALATGSTGGLVPADFQLVFTQNGGTALAPTITAVTDSDGAPTVGGESKVRIHLALSGLPTGAEQIAVVPASASAVFDRCGNALSGAAQSELLVFNDQRAPTVAAVSTPTADGVYGAGSAIEIRVVCDEDVIVSGSPTLTLETGGSDAVAVFLGMQSSSVMRFSFTVAAPQTTADLDCIASGALSLNGGSITDAAGNALNLATLPVGGAASSLASNAWIRLDTTAPTVQSVSSATADGGYGVGQSIPITIVFSEPVTVTGGTPKLTLETGASDAQLSYASGSGSSALVFTYVVAAGHASADLQYQSTGALDAAGATIRDDAGNNAILTLPLLADAASLAGSKALVIDTAAPTVAGVTSLLADGTYGSGTGIDVRVSFSEAVVVTGQPTITLETGASDLVAIYASGSGGSTLVFTATVAAGNASADLDYTATSALALSGGSIRDALTGSANAAVLTLPAPGSVGSLGANKAIVIDTAAPTVTGVGSAVANGGYGSGAVIDIQVTFSEAVTVSGGTPQLTLETGASDASASYLSGTGTTTLTFRYTVASGHSSADLDYVASGSLTAGGGSIADAAGNAATLALPAPGAAGSLAAGKAIIIDAVTPSVTSVTASVGNGTYGVGQVIPVTVTFNKAMAVTGTPTLTLETGSTDAVVSYTSGSGTDTLVFSYTIAAGHQSSDLDYTAVGALAGGTIVDTVANNPNPASTALPAPGASGSLGANKAIVIDGNVPTVQSVTSSAANGSYTVGAAIPVTVTFSEAVTVIGTPQLTLETGASDAVVNYSSGSGTATLTFTYTVAAGHASADLNYYDTASLALNGGSIKDAAANSATLTLPALGSGSSLAGGKAIVVDTAAPTVSAVTSATANGSYAAGSAIAIQVQFSEAVVITGTPQLTLETGASDAVVNYSSGSGSATLVFTYTVTSGHSSGDLDYAGTAALALNGGTIKDATGNNAVLTLAAPGAAGSLGANKAIVVDTAAPTVLGVTSALADGSYAAGQVVPIAVSFSEAVTVSGTPTLTLETGASDAVVSYSSGSGSSTLTFTYTVAAGQNSSDLDYTATSALALAGGTVRDAALNAAVLTLPAPGAAGSLGGGKAIVIDTLVPSITGGSLAASNATIDVSFSEGVYTTAGSGALTTADFALLFAQNGGDATAVSISGISAVGGGALAGGETTVRLTLAITGTPNGLETIEIRPASAAAIWDAVGNAAAAGSSTGAKALNDQSAAYVTGLGSATANGTYVAGQSIAITVSFSEAVTVTGTPTLVLETGSNDTQAVYASGSGTSSLTFTYTVAVNDVSADLDAQSANALLLNGGSIKDGSTNNANLTLPTPGQSGSLGAAKNLVVDAKAPSVVSLDSPTSDATYSTGAVIQVAVAFSEVVTVSTVGGIPQLRLETGATDANAAYSSGSGSSTLIFVYTVGSGQNSADLDVTATNALQLNGGTILDAAGNAAVLTVPAPGAAGSLAVGNALVIDTAGPAITGVTSSKANGTWCAGQSVAVQVQFGEAVLVTGTPQLALETGASDAVIDYVGGSGTSTLVFTYVVDPAHASPDLDCLSTSALSLNGGSMQDAVGNAAVLTLPAPGAAGSLSSNKNLVIATPTVTVAASDATANEGGDTGAFTITLSQAISTDSIVSVSAAGTALSGSDYVALAGTATIPAGSLGAVLTITPLNDAVAEGQETVELALAAGSGYALGAQTTAVVTIGDDDNAGIAVDPVSGLTVTEAAGGGNSAIFTVRLTSQPVQDVAVGISSSNAAEGVASPSELVFTSANWNDPQTVTVTGVDDEVDDGGVSFSIITSAAVSTDPQYSGRPVSDVAVTSIDNDDAGFQVTPTAGLVTGENGDQASFTVVLTSRPTAGVSIGLASSDAGEGAVSPSSLTFTPEAWNIPQTVTVVGIDDGESDGNVAYSIVTSAAASDDPVYNGRAVADVSATNADDDSAGVTVSPTSGLHTTTGGGQAVFTVALNSRPAASVTIALASSDTAKGTVSPASLVFTTANWDRLRVVVVTGQASAGSFAIATTCTSADANYNGLAVDDVEVENLTSVAAIQVTPTGGLGTTEYGDVAVFSVRLLSAPANDVTIPLRVSDAGEGDLGAQTSLVFTPADYSIPQLVTVTGLDDAVEDGNASYAVILDPASSADPLYDGYDAPDVQLTNADDDVRGVSVTLATGGLLDEDDPSPAISTSYDIVLDSEPTGTVVIAVSAGDQVTLSSSSFTFEPADWNVPQQLVVSVVDDAIDEGGLHLGTLSFNAIGGGYSQVSIPAMSVPINDDDAAAITVTPVSGLVTNETGGQASFSVALGSQPTANVTVLFASDAPAEGSVPASATFTPGSWQIPQLVTVTGVDDSVDDGDRAFTIVTTAVSADGVYNAINPDDVAVTNQDDTDEAGFLITPASGLNVTESAADDDHARSFSISLRTKPTADVTVALATSDAAVATVSPATITFTSANWATPQLATVSGVDDDIADGDQLFTILTSVIPGTDAVYSALDPLDVTGRCRDDDTAGVAVSAVSGDTSENGGTATFTVVLTSQPTADVSVPLTSPMSGEVTIDGTGTLLFTAGDWSTPQTVTLRGVDDLVDDGDSVVPVVIAAVVSTDQRYGGDGASLLPINPADASVRNTDDDVAAVVIAHVGGATEVSESGADDTYSITLASQPIGTVTILLSHDDQVRLDADPDLPGDQDEVTITSGDWDTPHVITVTAIDDEVAEGDHISSIQHEVVSADDSVYDGISAAPLAVTIHDDESVGVDVSPASGLATTEAGGTAQFLVQLTSKPLANVVVGLSSSNTDEGVVAPASLTFSPLNWDTAQTVTVTGVNDANDDGNVLFVVFTAAAISTDAAYNGLDPIDVSITNQDDDGIGVVVAQSGGTTEVGEAGLSDSFTVVLGSAPSAPVTITLTPSPQISVDTDATTAGTQLTLLFTTANWNQPRTVSVQAIDDAVDEADPQLVSISQSATSADTAYNGIAIIPLQVAVRDDDVAAVIVSPSGGLVTSESGLASSFGVRLASQPVADVTIAVVSDDTAEGAVSPSSLTFTSADWDQVQTVTVTGVDDAGTDDGDASFAIAFAASSADAAYQAIAIADVSATNLDDDGPGLVIAMSGAPGDDDLRSAENGSGDTFWVSLATDPGVGMTVTVAVAGDAQVDAAPATLTFDATNPWNVPQEVTIAARDDAVAEGDHDGVVTLTTTGSPGSGYEAVPTVTFGVAIDDDDAAGVTVTPNLVVPNLTLVVDEGGGVATFSVRLDSDPVDPVTIVVTASDAGQGSIVTAMPLSFTGGSGGDWSTPQTVTVAGVDNGLDEGDVPFVVRFVTSSGNAQYDARVVPDLQVVNRALNDTPTLTVADLTIDEDAGAQTISLSGIGAGQAGESQSLSIAVVGNDNPALTGTVSVSYASPATTGTLSFTPTANASGTAQIQVQVTDNGSPAASLIRTVHVTVNPVNDAPTVTVGGQLHLNRGFTAAITNTLLSAADTEDAPGTLTYTIYLKPPQGVLARLVGATWDGSAWIGGTWTALDTASTFTQADIDDGLLRYTHNNSSGAGDGFAFSVKDSGNDGTAMGMPLETPLRICDIVIDDTDPPLVQIPAADLTYVEDTAAVPIAPSGSVSDSDSPDLAGGYLQVTLASPDSGDEFIVVATGTGTGQISIVTGTVSYEGVPIGVVRSGHSGQGGEDLAIDLTAGDDTAVAALLRTIHYRNVGDNPPTAVRVLTVAVNDGDGGNASALSGSVLQRNVAITAINDAPRMVDPATDAPIAGDPWFATVVDLPISRSIKAIDPEDGSGVTYELTDGDGNPAANGGATLGTVSFTPATGAFTYTPAVNVAGQDDAFYVKVTDSDGYELLVPVRVHITGPDDADAPLFLSNAPMRSYDGVTMIYQADIQGGTTGAMSWSLVGFPSGPTPPTLDQNGNLNWTIDALPGPALNTYYSFGIMVEDRTLHRAAYQPVLIKVVASPAGNG
ncbi:MAG: hypothetical protein J0M02_04115 [Planctomycetes bacterium]|nr:hypothetical protein [Planctomycetota bacterium]